MGICCKPDSTNGHCSPTNAKHTCSEKSYDPAATKYSDVMSKGNLNYQMHAFCPLTSQANCGVSSSTSSDMSLAANSTQQTVYSNDMRYREGDQIYRQYDSCFYELNTATDIPAAKVD